MCLLTLRTFLRISRCSMSQCVLVTLQNVLQPLNDIINSVFPDESIDNLDQLANGTNIQSQRLFFLDSLEVV